ncbi:hypothetical protein BCR35DRAFT_305184 [Leucosporidium creatinivorum]|uniref:S-adenosyl-L-methionine-dependent methyltransferase n=1 Tax=Leucosporidium creatinivorum TaxID=106004 RepID=A0A1Y2F3Y4_9BASI|nr:hypothetical protein BCR35DRAFT_305184 [Leucosporidium creatinivorum]
MIPTPSTSHLSSKDFESVYEPAEDTFALLDALEQDAEQLVGSRLCLEIGSGSGCVSSFLARICGPSSSPNVDVLVFNPPYVETEMDEMEDAQESGVIERAWAGGEAGMVVTNRVLEEVDTLLAPGGAFYLVTIPQNKPFEIIDQMRARGLSGEVTLKRRAGGEHLHILRFRRSQL